MALKYYDEALTRKIKKALMNSDNVRVLSPEESSEELFTIKADEGNDKPLKLPFISLVRKRDVNLLNTNKQPLSYDAIRLKLYDKDNNLVKGDKALKLNAIPLKIEYQLDIYTKRMYEADDYAREFIFYLVNNPNVTIEFEYNGLRTKHTSTLHVEDTLVDNSDIPQKLYKDQLYRFTLNLYIDDAYYFSIPALNTVVLEYADLDVVDRTTGEVVESSTIDMDRNN